MSESGAVTRQFDGLDTSEAMPWQQEMLQRVHLFDKNGQKTAILLDRFTGRPAAENTTGAVIPIEYFDPVHEKELIAKLKQLYEKNEIEFTGFDRIRSYGAIIKPIREQLIKDRPAGYAFRPTPQEQVFLLKIFAELCKYPSISCWLAENTSTNFICAYRHKGSDSITDHERLHGGNGYYAFRNGNPIIGLTRQGALFNYSARFNDEFSSHVCEEVLHAYDFAKGAISSRLHAYEEVVGKVKWPKAQKHIDHLRDYLECVQAEMDVSRGRILRFLTDREEAATFHMPQLGFTATRPIPTTVTLRDRRAAHAVSMIMRNLDHAVNFQKIPAYQNLDESTLKAEFFAKVGKAVLLFRSDASHIKREHVKNREMILFSTTIGREICDLLEKQWLEYEQSRSYEEWEKAEKFAIKVFAMPKVTAPGGESTGAAISPRR